MDGVKCPHCGAYTVNEPTQANHPNDSNPNMLLSLSGICIVKCRACMREFVSVIGSQQVLWPLTSPKAPDGVPEKVKEAYEDARLSHAAGAKIGALMAARTALFRLLRDKEVSNFKQLVGEQIITPAIYGGVDQLRLWAAIAGHDDIDVDTFDDQEVEDILDYLGTALEAVYTHQARVDKYVQRTKELQDQTDATTS